MLLCAAVLFAIILFFGGLCLAFMAVLFWNPAVFSIDDVSSDSL